MARAGDTSELSLWSSAELAVASERLLADAMLAVEVLCGVLKPGLEGRRDPWSPKSTPPFTPANGRKGFYVML